MPAYPQSLQVFTRLGQEWGSSCPGFGFSGGLDSSIPLNSSRIKLSPWPEKRRMRRWISHSPKKITAAGMKMHKERTSPRVAITVALA